jgi:isopentenyl-diphosphate delta-isomerase
LTADVDTTPNANEVRDVKYVSKEELQAMFDDPGMYIDFIPALFSMVCVENSFTPWFKLIARDFLFGWWDTLLSSKDSYEVCNAKTLAGKVDGNKIFKML